MDTLTEAAAQAMADRVRHHALATGRAVAGDETLVAAWLGDRGLFINAAVVLALPDDWDAILARAASVIPAHVPTTLISPFATPDLTSRGWALIGHPPFMARLPGADADVPSCPELEVREITDRAGLETFEHALVDGYPMPDFQPYEWGRFYDERVLGGPTRFWVGFVDGEPVATSAVHVAAGVNNVEMISTLDAWRGKGYGAVLTWKATVADPSSPAILIASDLGRPVYERLGYTALSRWTMWMRPPTGE